MNSGRIETNEKNNHSTMYCTELGSVSEIAWQDKATRLAFAITGENGVGNGVQVYDTSTSALRVLDSSSSTYSGLSWRKGSAALAAPMTERRS